MSSSERTAWIRAAAILLVYGPHFGYVMLLFVHGDALARPAAERQTVLVGDKLHGACRNVREGKVARAVRLRHARGTRNAQPH